MIVFQANSFMPARKASQPKKAQPNASLGINRSNLAIGRPARGVKEGQSWQERIDQSPRLKALIQQDIELRLAEQKKRQKLESQRAFQLQKAEQTRAVDTALLTMWATYEEQLNEVVYEAKVIYSGLRPADDVSWVAVLEGEQTRTEQALAKIFHQNGKHTSMQVVDQAIARATVLLSHFGQRIEKALTKQPASGALLVDPLQQRLQDFNEEINAQVAGKLAFINDNNDQKAYAELAASYSKDAVEAKALFLDVVVPLKGNDVLVALLVNGTSDLSLRRDIVGHITNKTITSDDLEWAVDAAEKDDTALRQFCQFISANSEARKLVDKLKELGTTKQTTVEWLNWMTIFIDKSVDKKLLAKLHTNLSAQGVSREAILDIPALVKQKLVPIKNITLEKGLKMFARLAAYAQASPLNVFEDVILKWINRLGNLKALEPERVSKVLDILQYKAFKTDDEALTKLVTIAQNKDKKLLDNLFMFAGYKEPLPTPNNDWRNPGATIVKTFQVNDGRTVRLSQGRLNYFKNRHFAKHFDFTTMNANNTFFPQTTTDNDVKNSVENVVRTYLTAGMLTNHGDYLNLGNAGIGVGVENWNGNLYVTHYQSSTGVNLVDSVLERYRSLIRKA